MKCARCGKIIESKGVTENDYTFCNNLCRYLWNEEIQEINTKKVRESKEAHPIFLQNLDFAIDYPGLENRNLLVRASYWIGPQLYLDDKKLKPTRRNFFKRLKIYNLADSQGVPLEIKLNYRLLDAIPQVFVNGKDIKLAKPLTIWEYVLLCLPLLLMYMGGAIGGFIVGAAVFTNSILFRKINHKILRYSMVVITNLFAVMFFFQVAIWMFPYLNEWEFKNAQNSSIVKDNPKLSPLTSHVWETVKLMKQIDSSLIDEHNPAMWSKKYFYGTGDFVLLYRNGKFIKAKWSLDKDERFITMDTNGIIETFEIMLITENELVIKFQGIVIYSIAR